MVTPTHHEHKVHRQSMQKQEFATTDRAEAERMKAIANRETTQWEITELYRGCVTFYCLTRADGQSDERYTKW